MYTIDVVFFFKQKTAYEVRISDWSSDVCSSDLLGTRELMRTVGDRFLDMNSKVTKGLVQELTLPEGATGSAHAPFYIPRSAERRVGKECVSTCRSRRSPYH